MATSFASFRHVRFASVVARQGTRCFSADAAAHTCHKTQVYISKSNDPLLNLSVEHRILQITPPESTVLILYVNAPCAVLGRNQNPWLELNLARLAQIANGPGSVGWNDSPVKLIRRRSGGGTVFHDLGNVNFSVICPPKAFNRDKHAEMVVQALKSLGRPRTRVNGRHDIVMDADATEPYETNTFKISGSAYKLTRLRSLHHGTCLLRSPNLADISGLLRSPAEPFIKASGVDSVRSPVRNVDLDNDLFKDAVVQQFGRMYGCLDVRAEFGDDAMSDDSVKSDYEELKSRDWIYGQTPRFLFCTHPFEADPRPRPQYPCNELFLEVRHGIIDKFQVDGEQKTMDCYPSKSSLHDIHDWVSQLNRAGLSEIEAEKVGTWINHILGTDFTRIPSPATI